MCPVVLLNIPALYQRVEVANVQTLRPHPIRPEQHLHTRRVGMVYMHTREARLGVPRDRCVPRDQDGD